MSLEALALSTRQREMLTLATQTYAAQFDARAQAYLEARGLGAARERFDLGVVGDPLPGHEQFVGRLAIPYLTPSGVVSMKFRTMDEHGTKYLGLSGQAGKPRLFNVAALHTDLPVVAIVEGEFDAMALALAGLPAVGVPGVSSWDRHHPRCFANFDQVFVIGDNDVRQNELGEDEVNHGQRFADKVVASIRTATKVVPPPNVDVNEWIVRDGAQTVLEVIGVSPGDLRDNLFNLSQEEA